MNAVNDILGRVPLDQLADQLGTDQATAEQAARQAIATLMGGMASNASDPSGETALAGALSDHAARGLFSADRVDLNQVDTGDGAKIVQHVLGGEEQQVQSLGGLGGMLGNSQVQSLLRMLAPIVLGYLASQVASGKYGDILGSILGGGQQQTRTAPQQHGGGGLGDILGQILGGGAQQPQQTGFGESRQSAPANNPFNAPDARESAGSAFPIDESVTDGLGENRQQDQRRDNGGGLGDILGGIFGR